MIEGTPAGFLAETLDPGLSWMASVLADHLASDEARVLLLAIAGQESGWRNIAQRGGGPGRGPFQMEPETTREILANPVSAEKAKRLCRAAGVLPVGSAVYIVLLARPLLAVAFARLDLWCDPFALPRLGEAEEAWTTYLRVWRPGAPGPDRWGVNYQAALAAVGAKAPVG
jgi:hypothetical protein